MSFFLNTLIYPGILAGLIHNLLLLKAIIHLLLAAEAAADG